MDQASEDASFHGLDCQLSHYQTLLNCFIQQGFLAPRHRGVQVVCLGADGYAQLVMVVPTLALLLSGG